jgi:hypothetical protein
MGSVMVDMPAIQDAADTEFPAVGSGSPTAVRAHPPPWRGAPHRVQPGHPPGARAHRAGRCH